MQFSLRLEKLHTIMQQNGLDIVALIPGPNLRYLTGTEHYVMERPIVMFIPSEGTPLSVIPQLEKALFDRHPLKSQQIIWTDAEGYEQAFQSALAILETSGKTIGVEGVRLRFFEGELIRRHAPKAQVVNVDTPLAELRIRKDSNEIKALRKAIHMSEEALQRTLDVVQVGMSEREIANQLEANLKAVGGEGLSFKTILRGGSNSALPHSQAEDYVLQPGDPLLFDFGTTHQGYCADITRVVFVGKPSAEARTFYEIVQTANAVGRATAQPGATAESVDLATRQVFTDAGYAHLIRHRTGHGLGLEPHEPPFIVQGNQRLLEPGMVFTVEPGIYKIGEIGVRIEDDVVITETGAESITTFSRELLVID